MLFCNSLNFLLLQYTSAEFIKEIITKLVVVEKKYPIWKIIHNIINKFV